MTSSPSDPAGTAPAHATPLPVRVGFLALSDCAPLVVAHELGFDRRHGVRIELVRENSWAALRDGLIRGTLDAAHCLYGLVYGVHLGIGGVRHPMQLLMGLSSNGQSINLARHLADTGVRDGPTLLAAVRGGRSLTFAHTYPTGTHAMWLYYWLAAQGIHPLREVRMITVPPAQMVARLGEGSIDGCCVGEPWGAHAVAEGAGVTVATSQQVWPNHPEKVLAAGARFTAERPDAALGLMRALLEACRELDLPGRRAELAATVARPGIVEAPLSTLLPRFVGDYDDGLGRRWHDPDGLRFFDHGAVTCPRSADALWFLSQFRRWGLLEVAPDYAAVVAAVQQSALYRQAAQGLGIAIPVDDPAPARLCDGVPWNGQDPEGYAASFALRS